MRLGIRDGLEVEVRDNGRGMPTTYTAGVGLTSMRERAAELGGALTIESLPDAGTVVLAHLPLIAAEDVA